MVNPPVPFVLRQLRGNPGKRPLRKPPAPSVLPECPPPPDWLHEFAKQEWWRTAPELHVLGLLSSVDTACLAAYCMSYAMWREAAEQLADERLLSETRAGQTCRNPLVKVARDAAADMMRYAAEFGLTPVARTRIAAGVRAEPPGKFDGLLSGP
jgi:P27 family predicted phage terminase small subunit